MATQHFDMVRSVVRFHHFPQCGYRINYVVVAQLVERDVANVEVVGSSPIYHSNN